MHARSTVGKFDISRQVFGNKSFAGKSQTLAEG
jgi:hypothetical protein